MLRHQLVQFVEGRAMNRATTFDGKDLLKRPLSVRRERLEKLFAKFAPIESFRLSARTTSVAIAGTFPL